METITDEVCRRIRSRILDGRYPGGVFLTRAGLARELDIPLTSADAAIARLDREGWLERLPFRGARVMDWTTDDADEVGELRALLESQAARRAAGRVGPQHLARLEHIVAESERCLTRADSATERMSELNLEFHQLIIAGAGSQRLQRLLDAIMDDAVSSRSTYHLPVERLVETTRHHRDVLEAIAAGEGELAARRMHNHITRVYHDQAI